MARSRRPIARRTVLPICGGPSLRSAWMSVSARKPRRFGPATSLTTMSPSTPITARESDRATRLRSKMSPRNPHPIVLVAACVLLDAEGRMLLARRPEGRSLAGLWEFPGGKIEAGEAPEDAVVRELREELGIVIAKQDLSPLTFASHAYADFHLLMPVYLCRRWEREITAHEGQELLWVKPDTLHLYDMPPADTPLKIALRDLR